MTPSISRRAWGCKITPALLALGLGILCVLPPSPGLAQSASMADADATDLDAVAVTGIRGSVYRAQDIKRDADTFVDSVTALDIGALPDRSVTETLSRIPGVTIDRFLSVGDPEHFSAEGSGVAVRGLTQVRSELNGRDSFSASGGRSLSFQDVPSELMAGLDVYKNQKADMIEGGLGGTVNLRTFMPFDFEGRKFGMSLSANRGDFAEKTKPSGSILFSNRWQTGAGDFGVLVDLAHSELATRTDGLFVRPFFNTANSDLTGDGVNDPVWLPRGADWRTLNYERERQGAYLALQWRAHEDLEFFATAFQSSYDELWFEDAIFVSNNPLQVRLDASEPYELDDNVFVSGRLRSEGDIPMGTDIRASHRESRTRDYSFGMHWRFSERTELSSEVQLIRADTRALDSTVSLGLNVPWLDVDLRTRVPSISADTQFTQTPGNYYWGFTMDHRDRNDAKEVAWRADLKHHFDTGKVIDSVKFGVRITDRDATSIDTSYDWQPVFQTWMQGWALPGDQPLPGLDLNDTVNASLVNLITFSNFYRGGAGTPAAFYSPILATALGFPASYHDIHNAATPYYTCCYGPITPGNLDEPQWRNVQDEKTWAAYAMLNFVFDQLLLDGNIGVRVVRTRSGTDGFRVFPDVAYAPYLGAGESEPISARNAYTDVLPSMNLKWDLADHLIMRLAASKAIARPNFSDMQAYQLLSAAPRPGITPPDDGGLLAIEDIALSVDSYDNPYLMPMKADQFDLSLEWYFAPDRGGMAWLNLFHKDVNDYFRRQSMLVSYPGADGRDYDYLLTQPVNVGSARIQGVEIGWNQFFDFLPVPFDGLGMSANYTYIDSSTKVPNDPGVVPTDTDGTLLGGLPADGLSKNAYNLALFYEKGSWQVRFAYNWRSQYLLSVGPNGYNDTNDDIAWKLPVYSDSFGQLDGSVFYKISDHVQIGLEMNNLNNAEQRTLMEQWGAGRRVTSWYVNDRRYAATLRVTF